MKHDVGNSKKPKKVWKVVSSKEQDKPYVEQKIVEDGFNGCAEKKF